MTALQKLMLENKDNRSLDKLFGFKTTKLPPVSESDFTSYVSGHVSTTDQYALMAQTNMKALKDKFINMQQ
jgi:hypothetical protein